MDSAGRTSNVPDALMSCHLMRHNGSASLIPPEAMSIDSLTTLAFTVQSNPGTYALLLGSGASTSAGIPTGWSIVQDLIRRLALMDGESPADVELESWYAARFGKAPQYTDLLESLTATPAERQALLRPYIEPSPEEREEGLKVPTPAHRAIAQLVAGGFIRVILTTNFDRLIEQALEQAGVDHDVVASVDAIAGSRPLMHSPCLVVKLHGDYRDARIRNTVGELAAYEPPTNALLDQILDNHGLLVCGWSATWDPALRDAVLRQPNRRYGCHWAVRGTTTDDAQALIRHRQAIVHEVQSADQFLTDLVERVQSLADLGRPHPLTVDVSVATLKRLLADPNHRIRLHDFVMEEAERTRIAIGDQHFPPDDSGFTNSTWREFIRERVDLYQTATEVSVSLIAVGGAWSTNKDQDRLWGRMLERIASHDRMRGGKGALLALRRYPALRAMYAGGVAAVDNENFGVVRSLTTDEHFRELNDEVPMVVGLHPWNVIEEDLGQALHGEDTRRLLPVSDHLYESVRDALRQLIPSDDRYSAAFDRFEFILGMILADLKAHSSTDVYIPPPFIGSYAWRHKYDMNKSPRYLLATELESGDSWSPITAGMFGGSMERAKEAFDEMSRQHDEARTRFH